MSYKSLQDQIPNNVAHTAPLPKTGERISTPLEPDDHAWCTMHATTKPFGKPEAAD